MLVVFLPIFVADTKTTFIYDFVAPLGSCQDSYKILTISYNILIKTFYQVHLCNNFHTSHLHTLHGMDTFLFIRPVDQQGSQLALRHYSK